MRLLLINYEFPPFGGGASFSSAALAERLDQRGHRIDVLTSRVDGQSASETYGRLQLYRVPSWRRSVHDCGLSGAASFAGFALPRLERLLRRNRYDLIHCYFGLPCGPLGLYGLRRSGIPYVVSMRGSDVPGYDPTDRWLELMHWLAAPLTRRVLSAAAAVIPNSESLRSLLARFHPAVDCQVIPSSSTGGSADGPVARRHGGLVRVLCVSRLIPRKNIDVLLRAMARLRDLPARVEIVGTGKDAARLQVLARELQLGSSVIFHGARPHEEVLRMYGGADLFVLPALAESCSMAMIEAMSAGLPVVTTRVGGNVDLVRDGANGLLVDPGDVDGLATAIAELIADPRRMQDLGRASRARIEREFDPELHVARYEAVYERAMMSAMPCPG
jgi:glycosyltransferase involved in cell wall biosynthesis